MANIRLSDLNLKELQNISGDITSLGAKATIKNVQFPFDQPSIEKLAKILYTHSFKKENQKLFIDSLAVSKEDEKILTTGFYPFDLSPRVSSRFEGDFYAFVPTKIDQVMFYLVIKDLSFSFEFYNPSQIYDDFVEFQRVGMTIYPSEFTIEVKQD